jgi:hypothetical protein
VPHCVWIDRNGKLVANTNGQEIDGEKIQKVYDGKSVDFTAKNDIMEFEQKQPLFRNGNGGEERNVKYKSIITGYIDGLSPSRYSDIDRKGIGSKIYMRNVTLENLFREAYRISPSIMVLFDIKDTDKYRIRPTDLNWGKDKTFSYELSTGLTNTDRLHMLMQRDLYAYFRMKANVEMRKIKCYNIVKTGLKAKKKVPAKVVPDEDDFRSVHTLIQLLNGWGDIPVFDARSVEEEQLIEIKDTDLLNMLILKKTLNSYGLDIIETEKELEMFVISEVDE